MYGGWATQSFPYDVSYFWHFLVLFCHFALFTILNLAVLIIFTSSSCKRVHLLVNEIKIYATCSRHVCIRTITFENMNFSRENGNGRREYQHPGTSLASRLFNDVTSEYFIPLSAHGLEQASWTDDLLFLLSITGEPIIDTAKIGYEYDFRYYENINIPCGVTDGWPRPELQWLVNGMSPEKANPFKVVKEGESRLTLRENTRKEPKTMVRYVCKCVAKNRFGTSSKETEVNIYPGE